MPMKKLSKVFSLATVFGLFTEYPDLAAEFWGDRVVVCSFGAKKIATT